MPKYKYNIAILLALPFVTNCNEDLAAKNKAEDTPAGIEADDKTNDDKTNTKPEIKSEAKIKAHNSKTQDNPKPKNTLPTPLPNAAPVKNNAESIPPSTNPQTPVVPVVVVPVVLSVDEIRNQFASLTGGEAIDEFNKLKTTPQVPPLARETLDNYVEALLWKSSEVNGGQVGKDLTKFKVDGTSIEIEEDKDQWKKIDTDVEDRRVLLNWVSDRNLGLDYHFFESGMTAIKGINLLEQAVAWDDLEFVKEFFKQGTIFLSSPLNNSVSTPLAFAKSVPMAQFLLDQGAKGDKQVRDLTFQQSGAPASVLGYLKVTKAPQDVIALVENY